MRLSVIFTYESDIAVLSFGVKVIHAYDRKHIREFPTDDAAALERKASGVRVLKVEAAV